jgi:hypothetical protein
MTYAVHEKAAEKWNRMEIICKEAGCILITTTCNTSTIWPSICLGWVKLKKEPKCLWKEVTWIVPCTQVENPTQQWYYQWVTTPSLQGLRYQLQRFPWPPNPDKTKDSCSLCSLVWLQLQQTCHLS